MGGFKNLVDSRSTHGKIQIGLQMGYLTSGKSILSFKLYSNWNNTCNKVK